MLHGCCCKFNNYYSLSKGAKIMKIGLTFDKVITDYVGLMSCFNGPRRNIMLITYLLTYLLTY